MFRQRLRPLADFMLLLYHRILHYPYIRVVQALSFSKQCHDIMFALECTASGFESSLSKKVCGSGFCKHRVTKYALP